MIKKYIGRVGSEPLMRSSPRAIHVNSRWCFVLYHEFTTWQGRSINNEISILYTNDLDIFDLLYKSIHLDIKCDVYVEALRYTK